MEKTLLLIKPNVTEENKTGEVIASIEAEGFVIKAMKMLVMDRTKAGEFYAVHKGKPFYDNLIAFMTSGPIVAVVLARDNAVSYLREVIGNTDPSKAASGTVRARFGRSVTENAVHASDSPENAQVEMGVIFGADGVI